MACLRSGIARLGVNVHALLARSREPRCSRRSKMPVTAPFGAMLAQGAHVRRARNVELNNGAVLIAHKAVIHICPVNVLSCDLSIRIDIPRVGTLVEARDLPASGASNVVNAPCLSSRKP